MWWIYGITDKRDATVYYYFGQTQNTTQRNNYHSKKHIKLREWIEKLRPDNKWVPSFTIVATCSSQEDANLVEKEWIKWGFITGHPLYNKNSGGRGCHFEIGQAVIDSQNKYYPSIASAASTWKISTEKMSFIIKTGFPAPELNGIKFKLARSSSFEEYRENIPFLRDTLGNTFFTVEAASSYYNVTITDVYNSIYNAIPVKPNIRIFEISFRKNAKTSNSCEQFIRCVTDGRIFKSIGEATKFYKYKTRNIITNVLLSGYPVHPKTDHLERYFEYINKENIPKQKRIPVTRKGTLNKKIKDQDGNEYISIKEASLSTGVSEDTIAKSARNHIWVKYGKFKFEFTDETAMQTKKHRGIPIICYPDQKEFRSIRQAEIFYNLTDFKILTSIKTGRAISSSIIKYPIYFKYKTD